MPSGASAARAGRDHAHARCRGVWKAPAGTNAHLCNVDRLDHLLTDLQNGVLNGLGVNRLRSFPVCGTVTGAAAR
jgi:hypothetical protein